MGQSELIIHEQNGFLIDVQSGIDKVIGQNIANQFLDIRTNPDIVTEVVYNNYQKICNLYNQEVIYAKLCTIINDNIANYSQSRSC